MTHAWPWRTDGAPLDEIAGRLEQYLEGRPLELFRQLWQGLLHREVYGSGDVSAAGALTFFVREARIMQLPGFACIGDENALALLAARHALPQYCPWPDPREWRLGRV